MPEYTSPMTEHDVRCLEEITASVVVTTSAERRMRGVISRARALIAERDRLLAEIAEKESAPQCPHLRELIKENRAAAEEAQHANGELDRVEKERDAAVAELARLQTARQTAPWVRMENNPITHALEIVAGTPNTALVYLTEDEVRSLEGCAK